jgi:uncharacterized protein (DUF1697 family)
MGGRRAVRPYAALLRGVNVGGKTSLPMADVRRVLEGLGYERPQTLLASGNAVFEAAGDPQTLEAEIARALADQVGLKTEVMVRGPAELAAVLAANPFPEMAKDDPSHLVVLFLKGPADPAKAAAIPIPGRERIAVGERCLYIAYPDGIGRSKLTGIDRAMGTAGTARNWNTVRRLAELAASRQDLMRING